MQDKYNEANNSLYSAKAMGLGQSGHSQGNGPWPIREQ